MVLSDVVIVLSRPGEPGNVGAVCRAMKNMGLSTLRIAGTGPDSLEEGIVRARAVHAGDIWDRAAWYPSLEAAVADCSLVIGATRRTGRLRKALSLSPREAAVRIRDFGGPGAGTAALVFGNERTGLEDSEMNHCNLASHIPSDAAFPSLNLSHAVMIYAYELYLALGNAPAELPAVKGQWIPLDQAALGKLVTVVSDSLQSLGFYKKSGREAQELFFRDIFARAGITQREGKYLGDVFTKAAQLVRRTGPS